MCFPGQAAGCAQRAAGPRTFWKVLCVGLPAGEGLGVPLGTHLPVFRDLFIYSFIFAVWSFMFSQPKSQFTSGTEPKRRAGHCEDTLCGKS